MTNKERTDLSEAERLFEQLQAHPTLKLGSTLETGERDYFLLLLRGLRETLETARAYGGYVLTLRPIEWGRERMRTDEIMHKARVQHLTNQARDQ